jgi:hypothetical protein
LCTGPEDSPQEKTSLKLLYKERPGGMGTVGMVTWKSHRSSTVRRGEEVRNDHYSNRFVCAQEA